MGHSYGEGKKIEEYVDADFNSVPLVQTLLGVWGLGVRVMHSDASAVCPMTA